MSPAVGGADEWRKRGVEGSNRIASMLRRELTRRSFASKTLAGIGMLALPGVLAACGGGQGGFGSSSSRAPSAATKSYSGKIVIGINSDPPDPVKQAIVTAYRQRQPKVDVVWDTRDFGGPANYVSWLGTQLAAGNIQLDVVAGNYVPTFKGYINLDEFRGSTNPYTGHAWGQDLNWDFYRGVNALSQRIMLATQAVHINWFYNKDLFDKAGVQPPKNWDEFEAVCGKLKSAGITPIASNFDYMVPQWFAEVYFDQYHVDWVNEVRAQPGDWDYAKALDGSFKFNRDEPNIHSLYTYNHQRFFKGIKDGKLRFDTRQVAEIIRNMARIFPKYATADFFVLEDPYTPFLQQQVAIMSNGSWTLPELTADLQSLSPARLAKLKIPAGSVKSFNWGTFENPPMQGSLVRSRVRSVESASGEYISVVNKNAQQNDLVMDFVMFWLSKVGYKTYLDAYVKSGQFAPAGPMEVKGVQYPAQEQQLFSQLKFLGNAEASYNGFWTGGAGDTQLKDLHNLFKSALEGNLSPDQYGTQLQRYVTDNLEQSLKLSSLTDTDIRNPARRPTSA